MRRNLQKLAETQHTQARDQLSAFDRADGRQLSDFPDFDAVPVNLRNRGVIGNAEQHPSCKHALQFFTAGLESFGMRPDARNRRIRSLCPNLGSMSKRVNQGQLQDARVLRAGDLAESGRAESQIKA